MGPLTASSVLVTGGTGFIGSHLARRLVRGGARVHVLARPGGDPWRVRDVLPALTVWPGDVTDPASIEACLAGAAPEVVFHLAGTTDGRWPDPGRARLDRGLATNLGGTLAVLRAAGRAGVRRLVRAGSLEEYGAAPAPYDEGGRERPLSAYAVSALAATHACQMGHLDAGVPAVTLRLAVTYGPGQTGRFFVPSLIRHCLRAQPFELSAGEHGRDLAFVDDVVEAFLAAAVAPGAVGEVINVGSGNDYRIRDVAGLVLRLAGADIPLRAGTGPRRPGDVERMVGRVGRAERLLGWSARTGLEDGLARTIAWYREHPDPGLPDPAG